MNITINPLHFNNIEYGVRKQKNTPSNNYQVNKSQINTLPKLSANQIYFGTNIMSHYNRLGAQLYKSQQAKFASLSFKSEAAEKLFSDINFHGIDSIDQIAKKFMPRFNDKKPLRAEIEKLLNDIPKELKDYYKRHNILGDTLQEYYVELYSNKSGSKRILATFDLNDKLKMITLTKDKDIYRESFDSKGNLHNITIQKGQFPEDEIIDISPNEIFTTKGSTIKDIKIN